MWKFALQLYSLDTLGTTEKWLLILFLHDEEKHVEYTHT